MTEWIAGALANIHPLAPRPTQPPEIMALVIFILSAFALIGSGYRLGRFAVSGFVLSAVGLFSARFLANMTNGTPLWITSFVVPGSIAAILMYGFIGLIGRLIGMDEMTFGRRMALAGLTTVIGGAAALLLIYQYFTQDPVILIIAGLILLIIGLLVQFVQVHAVRVYHNYDELYDMPLEIPAGLTDRELWGKEE